jgi:hypothetical protein
MTPFEAAVLTYSVLTIAIVMVLSFILRIVQWGPWGPGPTYGGNPVVTGTRTRP